VRRRHQVKQAVRRRTNQDLKFWVRDRTIFRKLVLVSSLQPDPLKLDHKRCIIYRPNHIQTSSIFLRFSLNLTVVMRSGPDASIRLLVTVRSFCWEFSAVLLVML
jgi:hypothetical protein